MKGWKYILMVAIFLVSFVFHKTAFADPPKFKTNPEYIAITQELNQLQTVKTTQGQLEGYTPEEIDQKINELELQKFAFESGIDWGQCTNQTGQTLAVYGTEPGLEKGQYSDGAALYFLGNGQTTKDKWNCKGIYLPTDIKAVAIAQNGQPQELGGGLVIKVPNGINLVLKTNPETGVIEFTQAGAKILKSGETNWFIPNISQATIDARIINAPTKKAG
ncbi:MAG TPA: hypothetical protein VK203_19470 [Nostocaceae cyanobacterium]|nr:hypothetical protein [Nostocaceae cyanobacterium]